MSDRLNNMRTASITSKRQRLLQHSSMARSRGGQNFRSNSRRVGGASMTGLGNSRMGNSRFGGARGSRMMTGSRIEAQQNHGLQVLNEYNEDVTPVSLLTGKHVNVQDDIAKERSTDTNSVNDSIIGAGGDMFSSIGPFTRSVVADDSVESADLTADYADGDQKSIQEAASKFHSTPRVKSAKISDDEMQELIEVTVRETETIWMFELKGTCVPSNDADAAAVVKRNEDKSVFEMSGRKDMFTSQGAQTYNNNLKHKDTQITIPRTRETETQAHGWDIHDTYERGEIEKEMQMAKEDHARRRELAMQKFEAALAGGADYDADVSASSMNSSVSRSIYMSIMKENDHEATEGNQDAEKISEAASRAANEQMNQRILHSEELIKAISMTELMAAQNIFHDKQVRYRKGSGKDEVRVPTLESASPVSTDAGSTQTSTQTSTERVKSASSTAKTSRGRSEGASFTGAAADVENPMGILESTRPGVSELWTYHLEIVSHLNVTSIAWNKKNPDIIAVAYGQTDFTKQSDGFCLCWSLKNPKYPERIYQFPVGVMAVDFCHTEPHLLALGLYDGSVSIYNVRNAENKSVLDSNESGGTHQAPVWQLKWVNRDEIVGDERGEILASVSTDGRVTQWSITKGLAHVDLMRLKPVGNSKPGSSDQSSAFMSRQVGGTCFDFSSTDSSIYLAATEEGHIHKCSCSYNEQYLSTYHGHSAPVYKVKLSPFSNSVFLSCSADWSMRLWSIDKDDSILKIQNSLSPIVDISWSPSQSSVFADICEGRLEIWDLKQSTIDPVVKKHISDHDLTCVSFAPNGHALLVGDAAGTVHVELLHKLHGSSTDLDDVVADL